MEVAGPVLFAPPDHTKAMTEILRVIDHGAPIMAYLGDVLVGVLGLTRAEWWYNFDCFLTDRWFFTLPVLKFQGCGAALLAEAQLLATSSGLPVVINGHLRARGSGVFFTSPRVYLPQRKEPN